MPVVLRMRGVRKRYGAVIALRGVDLEVARGEVHALVGENGAGKSTLMKVLSGAVKPDAGAMELDGAPYSPRDPLAARAAGVAMIYQELNLAPDLSVEQNIVLGRESRRFGFVLGRKMRPRVEEALGFLDHADIAPRARVRSLGPAARQIVEIARALAFDAKIVVMDEPTSSLTRRDAEKLLALVRRLRDRDVSVIYISHFLEEVREVADRYTVLRDGESVASGEVEAGPYRDASFIPHIVEQMVGRSVDEIFPRVPHEPGEPILSLASLRGAPLPREATLELRRGEILGIAGLVGAGRTELLRAIFGLAPVASGTIRVGVLTDTGRGPAARIAQGVGLLSEDRKEEGLALGMSIADNVTLSRMRPFARTGLIDRRARDAAATLQIERLGIRCRGATQAVGELSGGNQQKAAIARLLHQEADVLLLDEPTRGIDVASKVEIYRLAGELAARGKAILFVSSYIPELLGICDRVAVMHRGHLSPAHPASELTEQTILTLASQSTRETSGGDDAG